MSNKFLLNGLFGLSLFLVSCGGKDIGKLEEMNAPSWAFDPYSISSEEEKNTKIVASGQACATPAGTRVQIIKAEADARLAMAKQIGVEINSAIQEQINEDSSTEQKNTKFKKSFEMKTQEIVENLPISGASRTHIWQSSEKDKTENGCDYIMFVRMTIDRDKIKKYISEGLEDYAKKIKTKDSKEFIEKAKENISKKLESN